MSKKIFKKTLNSFRKNTLANPQVRLAQNASIRSEVIELTMDWEHFRKIDHSFSDIVSGEMPATNQKSSGRCWGFAGLNLFRIYLGRKHNLKDFQFSQSFFMFWDKLEKSNYFLESILKTTDLHWSSRLVMHLLDNPIQDGGQWDMWVNLINKYGVVPQSEMPESYSSSKSMSMNRMITCKLREFAQQLRESSQNSSSDSQLQSMKTDMLEAIYQMLTIHLGTPPNSFDWQIRDKKNNFSRFENSTIHVNY